MPMLARWVSIGAFSAGVTGGIAGLVIGLFAYAPTAPVAAVELGFPATLAGGVVGLVAGMIVIAARRIRRHGASILWRIKHAGLDGCCGRCRLVRHPVFPK
jgi:hypothetical protein